MNPQTLRAFGEHTKVAVSPGLALKAIKARMAQGARVSPKLLQGAEKAVASGAKSTPAAMRRTALGASESARAAQGAKTFAARFGVAPQRAALQQRAHAYDKVLKSNPKSVTSPVQNGAFLNRGYSPAGRDFLAGKGTLAQAQKAKPTVLTSKGVRPQTGDATVVGKRVRGTAQTVPQAATAIGKRRTGAGMAYDKALLARQAQRAA